MKAPLFNLKLKFDTLGTYTEEGTDKGAKLSMATIDNEEARWLLEETRDLSQAGTLRWLRDHKGELKTTVVVPLTTTTPEALSYRIGDSHPAMLYMTRPLHTLENLNQILYTANGHLDTGAYLCCHSMTAVLKRTLLEERYPWGVRKVAGGLHYLWHRVCPKLRPTHSLYFALTHGKNRSFSRVELLGRLYRAGFEVVDEQFRAGEFFVVARKAKAPIDDEPPTGSPIITLHRKGLHGKSVKIHKFRTMYTYSEYIQGYVYQHQNLEKGGKFKDDYRVNIWGRWLRKGFLDELPMVWDMLRGDVKLVGVRPLSDQYFSLYTPEMQELRTRTKPGLLPPFYYEQQTPETLEEIQASERRYLEAYLAHPFATDWRYFWGTVSNILFHKKRSA